MAVSNLLRLVIHWAGLGEEGTLTWWMTGSSGGHNNAELDTACTAVNAALTTNETPSSKTGILGRLVPAQVVDLINLYEYPTDVGPAAAVGQNAPSGWVGTASTNIRSLQSCQVVSLSTGLGGRSFRGRQYWPTNGAAMSATCYVTNASTDALGLLASNTWSDIAGAIGSSLSIPTVTWVVYSRKLRIATPVSALKVDNRMDVQRRRAIGQAPTYTAIPSFTNP